VEGGERARRGAQKDNYTYHIRLELAAVDANTLQDLLDLDQKAWHVHEQQRGLKNARRTNVEDGPSEFDVAKVTRTLGHAFTARLALEIAVDGAHARVH